jgi:hypothetical protein
MIQYLRGKRTLNVVGFVMAFVLVALACSIPGFSSPPPAPTPTPLSDTLTFLVPVYSINLEPGDTVPGTRLEYIGKSGDTYNVRIDGQETTKRAADSFIWSGLVAPGVFATYELRLVTSLLGPLSAVGPVEILVLSPAPVEIPTLPQLVDPLKYSNITVAYNVPVGQTIPGTTLIYEGIGSQGNVESARLAQTNGHTLHAIGDSINWNGMLRDNVVLRYTNLRVGAFDETSLQIGGLAELSIAE